MGKYSYFILFLCLLLKIHLTDLDILIKNQSKFLKCMGFKTQKRFIYLLQDFNAKLILESVYEYRKAIDFDPYPESYIEQKEKNE